MAFEDFRADAMRCTRCTYCQWIPFDLVKSGALPRAARASSTATSTRTPAAVGC